MEGPPPREAKKIEKKHSMVVIWLPPMFQIDRLKPIRGLLHLKVLYMAHNFVREWREFEHLGELPNLEDLVCDTAF